MEHLALLGDQMKALAARQDEVEKNMTSAGSAEVVWKAASSPSLGRIA